MKALVYQERGHISLRDVPSPRAGHGEVLVRVAFTGICGTDLLIWHDKHSRARPPVTLGHEFSGVIDAAPEASAFSPGDRVVVEPLLTCGECAACTSGSYNACARLRLIGIDTDGSLADLVAVPEHRVIRIPDSLDLRDAAFAEPLAVVCHLLRRIGGVTQGDWVFITGGGPIGLLAGSLALARQARVIVSELNPHRKERARELGFKIVDPSIDDIPARVSELTGGVGAQVALEASGVAAGLSACIAASGIRARIGVVGLPKTVAAIDSNQVIAKELTLIGSRVYTAVDFGEAVDLLVRRVIEPADHISHVINLDEVITKGFEAIDRGDPVLKVLVDQRNESLS